MVGGHSTHTFGVVPKIIIFVINIVIYSLFLLTNENDSAQAASISHIVDSNFTKSLYSELPPISIRPTTGDFIKSSDTNKSILPQDILSPENGSRFAITKAEATAVIERQLEHSSTITKSNINENNNKFFPDGFINNNYTSTIRGSGDAKFINRFRRLTMGDGEANTDCEYLTSKKPVIFGIRCDEGCETEEGVLVIKANEPTNLILFGRNLYRNLSIALTPTRGEQQDDCTHTDRVKSIEIENTSLSSTVAHVVIEMSAPANSHEPFYFCIRESNESQLWFNQGPQEWLKIYVRKDFIPTYMKIIIIAFLLGLSGLFSGLNLGLMALDKNELQVIMKCGSETERRYARMIEPVRRNGNQLLCSILFSNTLVNSTISVFLEELSTGLIAIMSSTILIVLFGEILPQAFCSRHGLAVGARTIFMTKFCIFITYVLSKPISMILDHALGDEIGHAYDREKLFEFIQVTRDTNNLESDEVNIIQGALKIKKIQISEIMTRIDDVYMIDETAVLDFDTIQAICEKGYSRIPIHEAGNRRNIVAVMLTKDLALLDPDDKTPVQTMIQFYEHPRMFIDHDATIDKALDAFKTGASHMAIVNHIINDGDKDPYYEIVGIVTLEDVIEEVMQMEINDETDTLTDNRRKRRRKEAQVRDFSHFAKLGAGDSSVNVVTPQLCLAAYQYLATTVEPFSPNYLSDSILKRLLSQRIFYKVKVDDDSANKRLYTEGEPADYFIMILEGRVHVVCGHENLVFEGGPFNFFGKKALQLSPPGSGKSRGHSELIAIQHQSLDTPTRRESSANVTTMSRRESVVKGITNQFSLLTTKKTDTSNVNDEQIGQLQETSLDGTVAIPMTPTVAAGSTATAANTTIYFIPDYTVDIIANTSYLKVTRKDYETAYKATLVERGQV